MQLTGGVGSHDWVGPHMNGTDAQEPAPSHWSELPETMSALHDPGPQDTPDATGAQPAPLARQEVVTQVPPEGQAVAQHRPPTQ